MKDDEQLSLETKIVRQNHTTKSGSSNGTARSLNEGSYCLGTTLITDNMINYRFEKVKIMKFNGHVRRNRNIFNIKIMTNFRKVFGT